jgi:hypothetical protein
LYCKPSCKQRDYEARLRSAELGLGEHELVVTRSELEAIHDRLFVLGYIVEDLERDLAKEDFDEQEALDVLLDAVHECIGTDEPPVADSGAARVDAGHADSTRGDRTAGKRHIGLRQRRGDDRRPVRPAVGE